MSADRRGAGAQDRQRPVDQATSLQIEEDMPLQERTWRFQRVGWAAMGLLLVSALAGLFANGPLSWGKAQDPQGLLEN
jgi:hypothetical protein